MEKLIIVIALLLSVSLFYGFRSRKNAVPCTGMRQQVTITGHRGAGGLAQENTLSAIRKGLEMKCARIEIDVHQTADGEIMVMHDETIDRMTNGKGRIRNMTYDEIRKYFIKPFRGDTLQEKIPLLEDAIRVVNGKAVLLIELKEGNNVYPGIERKVIQLIRKHKAESWCMIHSFKEKILDTVHAMAPEIPLHQLLLTGMFNTPSADDYVTEVSVYNRLLTKSFIEKVHKAGKKVNVWTVNNRDEMMYFMKIGVDGIITDFPDLANEVLQEYEGKSK
jgi:glycerophosphoryl diester phosphodiesterase